MGNRRAKNCKAKRAKQPKVIKSKHQAWDKKSDESSSKSESAFERFFFSLLCSQWLCNKRRSGATENEDDLTLSRMAWHHARSSQEVDPMMDHVRKLIQILFKRGQTPNTKMHGGGAPKYLMAPTEYSTI
jgi:hypothetical protein